MTTEEKRQGDRKEFAAEIAHAIRDELAKLTIPEEIHKRDHMFIGELYEEMRTKRMRREKLRTQVVGWTIVTALGSVGTAAYHAFLYLREHLK